MGLASFYHTCSEPWAKLQVCLQISDKLLVLRLWRYTESQNWQSPGGAFLVIQWLRLLASDAGVPAWSLVRNLKSQMLDGSAKRKNKYWKKIDSYCIWSLIINNVNQLEFSANICGVSLLAQLVKNPPAMQEMQLWSLGLEDPLEEGMATHTSILSWRIPIDRAAWWDTVHGVVRARSDLATKPALISVTTTTREHGSSLHTLTSISSSMESVWYLWNVCKNWTLVQLLAAVHTLKFGRKLNTIIQNLLVENKSGLDVPVLILTLIGGGDVV